MMGNYEDELWAEWYAQGCPRNEAGDPILIEELDCEDMGRDHEWTEPEEIEPGWWERTCKVCGAVQEECAVHEYSDETIEIAGKRYRLLKAWTDTAPCSECGKVVMDIPLILFAEKGALLFHIECAEKIGLQALRKAGRCSDGGPHL